MIKCKTCSKEFYPYLGNRIFCSTACYKEQKHLDNVIRWKKDRFNRINAGKLCKRCKELFNPQFNNSRYCNTCKEILMDKPKQKRKTTSLVNKKCKDCEVDIFNVHRNKIYCTDCTAKRHKQNKKNSTKTATALAKKVNNENKARGKIKDINLKWLYRNGVPDG